MAVKNPLYPGYYPGEDIRPQRGGGGGRKREFEPGFTPDMVEDFMESLNESNLGILNFPKWAWEQEKKNLELAWKANYYGDTLISPTEASAGGAEEVEDLPGAVAVGATLNPVEWIKDPKKQLKEVVWNPITATFDRDDFYQKAKDRVWREKLLKDENSPFALTQEATGDAPVLKREKRRQDPDAPGDKDRAIIESPDIDPNLETNFGAYANNLYRDVAVNTAEYMGNSSSIFARNNKYGNFNKALLSSLHTELEAKKDLFSGNDRSAVDSFQRKVELVDVFDDLGLVGGIIGSDKNKSEQISLDGRVLNIRGGKEIYSIKHSLGKLSDIYDKELFGVSGLGEAEEHLENLKASLEYADGLLDGVSGSKGLKNYVNEMKSLIDREGQDGATEALLRKLKLREKGLYRNTADGGVLGGFVRNTVDKSVGSVGSELSRALQSKNPNTNNYIVSTAGRRLGSVVGAVTRDWKRESANQLAQDFAKGNIPTAFIWQNAIKPKIEKWTPSYWVGQFLDRSHYFGLKANQDVLKGDIKGTFISGLVEKYSPLITDNNFKIKVAGTIYNFKGGKDFKSVIEVANLFDPKIGFSEVRLLDFLNGTSKEFFDKDVIDNLYNFRKFVHENETLRKALGFELLGDGTIVGTGQAKEFLNNLTGKELKKLGLSPTVAKAGIIERYSAFLSRGQDKFYNSVLGKAYKSIIGKGISAREKVIKAISEAIAKAFGVATDGLGFAVEWLVRVAVQYVLNKIGKVLEDFWKAARKLDFSDLVDDAGKALASAGRGILTGCVVVFAPIILFVILIVTIFIATFSNFPAGRIGEDATGAGSLFLTLDNFQADCSDVVENPSQAIGANDSSSSVARRAFNIVEGLERGFWCYFNRHPSYPELFDEAAYAANPNPPASVASNTWDLLFWCTFLPWKAGANIPMTGNWARADGMERNYREQRTFVSGSDAFVDPDTGSTNIQAGDIVFINSGSSRSSNHVGMVYEVTRDFVTTVHSNTGLKVWSYPVSDSGSIQGIGAHSIVGFGR